MIAPGRSVGDRMRLTGRPVLYAVCPAPARPLPRTRTQRSSFNKIAGYFTLGVERRATSALAIGILIDAAPPSSRGLGRHPFKVEIAGSNPAGGTLYLTPISVVARGRRAVSGACGVRAE